MAGAELPQLHHAILTGIVERGFAPEVEELAERLGVGVEEVERGLRALHEEHGVVLHPRSTRIWVAHPFSLAPTGHLLVRGERRWWSNCAWCALGAAALVGGDVKIYTALGGEERQIELRVAEGSLLDTGYVVHFPVPMARAWDNVVYTCSTMLVFEDEPQVNAWCRRHRIGRGDVQPIATVARMAKVWYGRHLDPDWRKWSASEAREIFERFGLTHEIWRIPTGDERF